jgi:hypothetical protein
VESSIYCVRIVNWNDGRVPLGGVKNKIQAVCRDAGWALGPEGPDFKKPPTKFSPKEAVGGIVSGT